MDLPEITGLFAFEIAKMFNEYLKKNNIQSNNYEFIFLDKFCKEFLEKINNEFEKLDNERCTYKKMSFEQNSFEFEDKIKSITCKINMIDNYLKKFNKLSKRFVKDVLYYLSMIHNQ